MDLFNFTRKRSTKTVLLWKNNNTGKNDKKANKNNYDNEMTMMITTNKFSIIDSSNSALNNSNFHSIKDGKCYEWMKFTQ